MHSATKARSLVQQHFRKFKSGFNRAHMQQGKKPPITKHLYNTLMILTTLLYLPELKSHILKSPPVQLGM